METAAGFDREWPHARRGPWKIPEKRFRDPERLAGLRVGRPSTLGTVSIQPAVLAAYEQALATLAARGASIVPVDFTDFDFAAVRREAFDFFSGATPLGRPVTEDEVALAAVHLLLNSAVTGSTVFPDGGYSLH